MRWALFFFAITCLAGCAEKETVTLHLYCSETFWDVMWEESRVFEQLYGVRVVPVPVNPKSVDQEPAAEERRVPAPWRNRPKMQQSLSMQHVGTDPAISGMISSLGGDVYADLFLTDDPKQLGQLRNLLLSSHEYPLCYLKLVLLVPTDNPRKILSAEDAIERNLSVGIVSPGKDGMGYAGWERLVQSPFADKPEHLERSVQVFDHQSGLLAALEQGEIDAALAWDAVGRKASAYADIVPLDGDARLQMLVSLRTAAEEGYGRRFADFLISHQGRGILRQYGFTME